MPLEAPVIRALGRVMAANLDRSGPFSSRFSTSVAHARLIGFFSEMFMRRLFLFLFAAMLLLSSPAFAAGKVGLWSVTTTYQFGMRYVPPALVSLARSQGLKPPVSGQPFTHHMCMVEYEAKGRDPL